MFRINKEKRIANQIREMLYKRGFKVETKFSKNTKSVYLILDNGACSTIRISDHINYKNKSKYNVIKNYQGKKTEYSNGKIKIFYNFHMIGRLIADIESERSNKILRYGYRNYKTIRDKEDLSQNYIFYKQAA